MTGDPFRVLGLPARPDLTDDDVRAAWRRVAAATHPDRADGGDPQRFAAAAAAYTVLRTRYGRGEAYADLVTGGAAGPPGTRGASAARPQKAPPAAGTGGAGTSAAACIPEREADNGGRAQQAAAGPTAAHAAGARRRVVLLERIRAGRPGVLLLRIAAAAAISVGAVAVTGGQPATPAVVVAAVTWLWRTARYDLAPPRGTGRGIEW